MDWNESLKSFWRGQHLENEQLCEILKRWRKPHNMRKIQTKCEYFWDISSEEVSQLWEKEGFYGRR